MRCGVPVMIFATSPCSLSQNEQRNPLAFILAITGTSPMLVAIPELRFEI